VDPCKECPWRGEWGTCTCPKQNAGIIEKQAEQIRRKDEAIQTAIPELTEIAFRISQLAGCSDMAAMVRATRYGLEQALKGGE